LDPDQQEAPAGARPLRIVILSETYAQAMGYAGTCMPAALAKKPGVEVHYVTAGLPVYYNIENFDETYGAFQKGEFKPGDQAEVDGYVVHYLGCYRARGGVRMRGLREKLAALAPDIVQTFGHVSWAALDAALAQPSLGYRLFTGNHTTASVYPLARMKTRWWHPRRLKELVKRGLPGRFISRRMELCYGATADCSDVARRFFGVDPAKLRTVPLGVETEIFHPAADEEEREAARALRNSLGVGDEEILCVYTGRFTAEKNPLLLAQAVAGLRARGEPYRAVFFGEGVQRDAIAGADGAVVRPFVHYSGLGDLYRAADVGVWPTQESTSMIDAAACGTPIIVNDTIAAVERVEGNGLTYRLNDLADLERALLELKPAAARAALGAAGARKMAESFSWSALVEIRLKDYRHALGRR
jgi:glycosyltransferase involved in cell wall biosynthesis